VRILQIPDSSIPAPDLGRVEMLEKIAKSILQRIEDIEERIKALEQTPTETTPLLSSRERTEVRDGLPPSPEPTYPSSQPSPLKGEGALQITLDGNALKKDLFAKMWKYLNDKAAA
jgi:hypothetical protein